MIKQIEAYKELLLHGVDPATAADLVQTVSGLDNEALAIVVDVGGREAEIVRDNINELCYVRE